MKKNNIKNYAKALAEILLQKHTATEEKKIIERFLAVLVKNGLEKKAKEIINLTQDLILEKQGKRKIIFQTARETTKSQKKILNNIVKEGDIVKEKINPELIAGVKIIINDSKQFDGSLQRKLQNII